MKITNIKVGYLECNCYILELDNKVLIVNKNYKSYITKEEFLLLYKEVKFIIYNPKDSDLVDEIKDKEYYSWTHK